MESDTKFVSDAHTWVVMGYSLMLGMIRLILVLSPGAIAGWASSSSLKILGIVVCWLVGTVESISGQVFAHRIERFLSTLLSFLVSIFVFDFDTTIIVSFLIVSFLDVLSAVLVYDNGEGDIPISWSRSDAAVLAFLLIPLWMLGLALWSLNHYDPDALWFSIALTGIMVLTVVACHLVSRQARYEVSGVVYFPLAALGMPLLGGLLTWDWSIYPICIAGLSGVSACVLLGNEFIDETTHYKARNILMMGWKSRSRKGLATATSLALFMAVGVLCKGSIGTSSFTFSSEIKAPYAAVAAYNPIVKYNFTAEVVDILTAPGCICSQNQFLVLQSAVTEVQSSNKTLAAILGGVSEPYVPSTDSVAIMLFTAAAIFELTIIVGFFPVESKYINIDLSMQLVAILWAAFGYVVFSPPIDRSSLFDPSLGDYDWDYTHNGIIVLVMVIVNFIILQTLAYKVVESPSHKSVLGVLRGHLLGPAGMLFVALIVGWSISGSNSSTREYIADSTIPFSLSSGIAASYGSWNISDGCFPNPICHPSNVSCSGCAPNWGPVTNPIAEYQNLTNAANAIEFKVRVNAAHDAVEAIVILIGLSLVFKMLSAYTGRGAIVFTILSWITVVSVVGTFGKLDAFLSYPRTFDVHNKGVFVLSLSSYIAAGCSLLVCVFMVVNVQLPKADISTKEEDAPATNADLLEMKRNPPKSAAAAMKAIEMIHLSQEPVPALNPAKDPYSLVSMKMGSEEGGEGGDGSGRERGVMRDRNEDGVIRTVTSASVNLVPGAPSKNELSV